MLPLSEAIRIGSLMNKQVRGKLWDQAGGTCALGSAAWAAGIDLEESTMTYQTVYFLLEKFPVLSHTTTCPACIYGTQTTLDEAIVHLNDEHRWSREAIADWVASIEQKDAKAEPVVGIHEKAIS